MIIMMLLEAVLLALAINHLGSIKRQTNRKKEVLGWPPRYDSIIAEPSIPELIAIYYSSVFILCLKHIKYISTIIKLRFLAFIYFSRLMLSRLVLYDYAETIRNISETLSMATDSFIESFDGLNQLYSKSMQINHAWLKTKRASLKRAYFILIFGFIIYFLFLSAIPGNENIMCSVFALNECTGTNGDGSSALCTAYGSCNNGPMWGNIFGDATSGEFYGVCCGDDSATEYTATDDQYNGGGNSISWAGGTTSCCNTNDCVSNAGNCYTGTTNTADFGNGAYFGTGLNAGGVDTVSFCYGAGGVDAGAGWLDCDIWYSSWCANAAYCGTATGVYSGEGGAGFGEYAAGAGAVLMCCGDDTSEYYATFTDYTGSSYGVMDWGTTQSACCNAADMINYNSNCVTTGTGGNAVATGYSGHDQYAYPYTSGWLDLDGHASWPAAFGANVCGGGAWIYMGDSTGERCSSAGGAACYDTGQNDYGCCGDDTGENYRTRVGGTDAPTGYTTDATVKICCDASTDCVEGSTCTASTGTSGTIPTKAYCSSGTWYGGDYSNAACDAIAGVSRWNLNGDLTCCGDDSIDNVISRLADTTMENGYASSSGDDACCTISTNCVDSSTCHTSGTSPADVDLDGDNDYCNLGTWRDCNSNDDCVAAEGEKCSSVTHDCFYYGYIFIKNLGTTGIEETNQEYTSVRSVFLSLNYTDTAVSCRYTNYDDPSARPPEDYAGWTRFESCLTSKIWELTESAGRKTVYYQINASTRRLTFNDSIYYNFTGTGLDITPATKPTVTLDDFTNDDNNAIVSWSNSTDTESSIFNIPLRYYVELYTSTGTALGSVTTTEMSYNFSFASQVHGTIIYANVSVINSVGMKTNATGGPLEIDLVAPGITLMGSAYNQSSLRYVTLPRPSWIFASTANFSWNASDLDSGVSEYSYVLSTDQNSATDSIAETSILRKTYTSLRPGTYYFSVKAKDIAGNWGTQRKINMSIDSTPPTRPTILDQDTVSGGITFTWTESADAESDILKYMINLTTGLGVFIRSFNQTDLDNRSHTFSVNSSGDFNATVGAMNGAGIWMWSNGESSVADITPPLIYALPNRTTGPELNLYVSHYPILKTWTDEDALCMHNESSSWVLFEYTNTTYHETKLSYLDAGTYGYIIRCVDMYGNEDTAEILFQIADTVPDTFSIANQASFFEGQNANIRFKVTNTDNLVGITDFNLLLDGEDYPFNIFDEENGYYNLSFAMPRSGTYDMSIETSNIDAAISLTSKDFGFNLLYEDQSIAMPSNKEHMTFVNQETSIGLATDDDLNMDTATTEAQYLNITNINMEKRAFIFNTNDIKYLNDRDARLKRGSLVNSINPSFGYPISEENIIDLMLVYPTYTLVNPRESLKQGAYRYNVKRMFTEDITIKFTDSNDASRVVI
jgi:hypothetical protein